jgi:acyl carrier protein
VTSNLRKSTTLATVIAIVQDLIQDWGLDEDTEAGAQTRLASDLQFTSVDIIQLCVALEECYDRRFGFHDLLMKDGSYVGDLTLGHLAAFVDAQLATEQPSTQEAVTS